MNFKEYLILQGMTDSQATVACSEMASQNFFLTKEQRLEDRFHALKVKHTKTEMALEKANHLIDAFKKSDEHCNDLKEKVSKYEQTIKMLMDKQNHERAQWKAKMLLHDAVDMDYALFKLGEIELSEAGDAKDLELNAALLRQSHPHLFKQSADQGLRSSTIMDKSRHTHSIGTNDLSTGVKIKVDMMDIHDCTLNAGKNYIKIEFNEMHQKLECVSNEKETQQ